MKKTSALIIVLLAITSNNSHSMKREHEAGQTTGKQIIGLAQLPNGTMVEIIGLILSQDAPLQLLYTNFEFNELIPELKAYIIELLASMSSEAILENATKTINALAQTNKELNNLINDPIFCLKLIKHLAQKFNCTDEKAADTLQTKAAKERSTLQNQLTQELFLFPAKKKNLSDQDFKIQFIKTFDSLRKQGVDLDYVYGIEDDIPTLEENGSCYGMTALMFAVATKIPLLVQQLLKKGANINAINPCGRTALMIAVSEANVKAVKLLLKNGAHIDQQEFEFGDTALCIACAQYEEDEEDINAAKKEIVRILLKAGANPELGDPLYVAESHGANESYELVDYILKNPDFAKNL